MVNLKRAAEILYNHFDNVTAAEFVEGLKRSSPELFEQKQETGQILLKTPAVLRGKGRNVQSLILILESVSTAPKLQK